MPPLLLLLHLLLRWIVSANPKALCCSSFLGF
jgi:hypothetical protein